MMKHFSICLITFFTVSILSLEGSSQPNPGKGLTPTHWIRSRKIDVKHVAIELRFDWQKKQAYGMTAVTVTPFNSVNQISLDAGMLEISSITLANTPLKFEYDGGDKNDGLKITLDRVYQAGEEITVKITYRTNWVNATDPNNLWGSYGKGIRFFEPTSTEPRKRKQIWSMGLPESNRYWFPCYDGPNDFRTSEFKATVDKNLLVVSNGILIETKTHPDGSHTFHWKMDRPYANHQTSFVVGEYVEVMQNFDDIKLFNYSYPDEVAAVTASVERLPDMVKFYSEFTGVKYPYPTYSQIFVQEYPWGGGHNITASTLSENMIDDFGTHADFFYLWDGVEANDLAAQWFGNLLTPHSWEHSWLNKSFATYFSGLYSEYKNGLDEFQLWNRAFNQITYLNDWNSGIRRPVVTNRYSDLTTITADNYSSLHGAEVLHMLRKQLGEENWRKAIRHYVKSNAHQSVTTEDFRKAIEESTGEPMDWFFDQWLYKMGHPVFEVTKNYNTDKKQLILSIQQTQKMDSASEYQQTEFFQGKMEIEIDGRIEQVWIEPKHENEFYFQSNELPKIVNVDYEGAWIKEIKFEKSFSELLYQFQNDKDVVGRTTAMKALTGIARLETTSAADKQRIYAAFRSVITSNSYWRFRQSILTQLRGLLTFPLDKATTTMLLSIIKNEESWMRAGAIFFLSGTNDKKYAPLYLSHLNDKSDRVINAAAFALGKTKSPTAFDALVKLKDKPSWKNQSLISALNGLKQLGDPRGFETVLNALKDEPAGPRWTLANNTWDYRIVAAETLVVLGKGIEGYPVVHERFQNSIAENDVNDIFQNTLLIAILGDPRGQEAFDLLKIKFKDDENAMAAVNQYETQFKEALKNTK